MNDTEDHPTTEPPPEVDVAAEIDAADEPEPVVVSSPPPARRVDAQPNDVDDARRRFARLAETLRERPVGRQLAEYLSLRRRFRRG
ncbi:MAG: hypothetical protein AAF561_11915 [Planctomycetota bacterium]